MEDINYVRWTVCEDHLNISPALSLASDTKFVVADILGIRTPRMIHHMLGHPGRNAVLSNVVGVPFVPSELHDYSIYL